MQPAAPFYTEGAQKHNPEQEKPDPDQRMPTVHFHLQGMPRKGKFIGTEIRSVIVWGWGGENQLDVDNKTRGSCDQVEAFLDAFGGDGYPLCPFTRSHLIVHLELVKFMEQKLDDHKTVE